MPGPIGWIVARAIALGATIAAIVRKPGTPEPVSPAERARRGDAARKGPRGYYGLGCGGTDPKAPLPWGTYQARPGEDAARVKVRRSVGALWCDCSGFIAWLLGVPRKIAGYARGYGWLSTDGLIADADDPAVELVQWVPLGATIEPWVCLVVYGSVDTDHDGDRDRIGHVGIVIGVPVGWTYQGAASLELLTILHCAASKSDTGAIRVSDGKPWAKVGRLLAVL